MPARGRQQRGEPRVRGRRQVEADPRLQDAVALDDPPGCRVEPRPVERMGQRADQPAGRVARHLGVGVERDHEADPRQARRVGAQHRIARVRSPRSSRLNSEQLAALPLPAHPAALRRVPEPAAMEQEEEVRAAVAGDTARFKARRRARRASRTQRLVLGHRLVRGVGEVGQQGEAEARVGVGQVVGLQPLEQASRRCGAAPASTA